jgi:peptidylprolyl isomerase
VKFKHFLTAGILFTFLAACGTQQVAEQIDTPLAADDVGATEETTELATMDTELDEKALQEMIANMAAQQQALPEVILDETAMADFLSLDMETTDSGLQYFIEEEGPGAVPQEGDVVQVHYTGKLADGTIFDNSYEYEQPLAFALGKGMVIPGWDEGISLLSVGSKAKLIMPPELAYGEFGAGGGIPPNATLYFDVELLDILPGSPESPAEVAEADYSVTDSGLKYFDFTEGDGPVPEEGQVVSMHYTGWLEDGTKFDSSLDYGLPFIFPVGQEYVIPGWEEGIASMKVGGKRQLVIPAELAFGDEGAGEIIPADATLIFEVELLEIQS